MKFENALRLLRKGKKVRLNYWAKNEYIESNGLVIRTQEHGRYDVPSHEALTDEWEEFKENRG